MKKNLAFPLLGILLIGTSGVFAQSTDTQLLDQIASGSVETPSLTFTQAKSCESIEDMLKKYAKERNNNYGSRYLKGIPTNAMVEYAIDDMEVKEVQSISTDSANTMGAVTSSSTDFSTTNIQKSSVDEPEIIKTDGKYFYYYNSKTNKVSIISSPLDIDSATIDFSKANIVKEIAVPKGLYDVELFIQNDRLVIMGNYRANSRDSDYLYNGARTILAIYDVENVANLELIRFENLPGYYKDSRLIDNQLYVITQQSLNRYSRNTYASSFTRGLSSVEVTKEGTTVNTVNCSDISYVLPEDENLNMAPVFTIVNAFNIKDTAKKGETTALLSPSGEIHMSKNSLYLVSHYYTPRRWSCPRGVLCISSIYWGGETQTLIHKFERKGLTLNYKNTAVVPGYLLNQYSMDEDNKGNFRILTEDWKDDEVTNLYVLDKNLKLAGKLENIEPGEEFKSSRYIGDKLYLVTFEQIDPLFVIDIADITNPTIIGELEIPGYSTYLHPLKVEGTKQYLLGLGYGTHENQWGGIVNSGVKLSLFEVDYGKKDENNYISVKELDSLTQGGQSSTSEALSNPRLFVMDKNYNVTLPLNLTEWKTEGQNCSIVYDENGNETSRNCYDITKQSTRFIGLKTFNVTPENGIKEVFAKDYLTAAEKAGINVKTNQRYLSNMRVGYAGDALYVFNPLFADFVLPNNDVSKMIEFK